MGRIIAALGAVLVFAAPAAGAGFHPAPGSPTAAQLGFPNAVAVGRLNRDAALDVAIAHASGFVSVLLGDGTGRLSPASGSPSATGGSNSVAIATADFNRDGNPDAAVASLTGDRVTVLLGDGTGRLAPAPGSPIAAGAGSGLGVSVADFNRDAKPDVSVANGFTNDVAALLGRGNGSLFPATGSPFGTRGQQPVAVHAGDFNHDGKPDVAVANQVSNDVSIMLGDGTGRLSPSLGSPFATGGISAASLDAADFDRNGALDVAVANTGTDDVSVLLGDGHGGLAPLAGSPFPTGGDSPISLAAGDLSGDARSDLVVANLNDGTVSVLLNDLARGTPPR